MVRRLLGRRTDLAALFVLGLSLVVLLLGSVLVYGDVDYLSAVGGADPVGGGPPVGAAPMVSDGDSKPEAGEVEADLPPTADGAVDNYTLVAKWEHNPVTYGFYNCPSRADCGLAHQAVREAIEAWDAAAGITLNEIEGEGDIYIGWFSGDHGDGYPFDGPGGILGHAFFPVSWLGSLAGDIHFDDDETWVFDPPTAPLEAHLRTVALHEGGHALGLGHSEDPNAVMWEEYKGMRTLTEDDIAGVQALYGPPNEDDTGGGGEAPPETPPPPPPSVTATTTSLVHMRAGPGTGYQSVGSIPANTTVPVLGRNASASWLYVEYNGLRGWVAAWLCFINGDLNGVPVVDPDGNGAQPPEEPPEEPTEEPGGVMASSDSNMRIRSGPGTSYTQIGTLPAYTAVPVLGRDDDGLWLYIQYGDMRGWIAGWLATVLGDLNTVPVVDADGNPVPVPQPLVMGDSWLVAWLADAQTLGAGQE
jgi:uncharacterized protein YraI